jgi:hypothetical protein
MAKKTSKKAESKAKDKKVKDKAGKADKKETKNKKKDGELDGLTNETKETGIITFKDGSGSQDLNLLIGKNGFERDAVLKEAKELRKAGKMFAKSDPAKKYNKVAGIMKSLQKAGYKLMSEKAAIEAINSLEKVSKKKKAKKKSSDDDEE